MENKENIVGTIKESRPLSEYMKEFLAAEVEPFVQESTYRSYLEGLNSNFYPEPIAKLCEREFTAFSLEQYYQSLLARKSRQTTVLMVTLTKRLSSYMYGRRSIPADYGAGVSLPRRKRRENDFEKIRQEQSRKRIFSAEDIRRLYQAYKLGVPGLNESVLEWCPLIMLQLETFMRASEVISIFMENIDLEKKLLWVRNTVGKRFQDNDSEKHLEKYLKLPKNGEQRVVPLSPLAMDAVERMMKSTRKNARNNPQGLLYPYFDDGRMRTIESYERNFKKICDAVGVDRDPQKTDCVGRHYGLNTHALRHTGITLANTAQNANIINTALMAGHSLRDAGGREIGTESVYIHTVVDALRQVRTPSMVLGLGQEPVDTDRDVSTILEKISGNEEIRRILRKLLTSENPGIIIL